MHQHLQKITIELQKANGLSGEHWKFYVLGNKLAVDTYIFWTKQSKRHKMVSALHWSRLDSRTSTMKMDTLPLTPEVKTMAKKAWLAQLEAEVEVGFA